MEKKKFNQRVVGQVKNIYKFNESNLNKIKSLNAKIAELTADRDILVKAVEEAEKPVIALVGYKSSDLIETVVTPLFNEDGTPKMDPNGKYQMKKKTYVCKYGEAFLPSEMEVNVGSIEVEETTIINGVGVITTEDEEIKVAHTAEVGEIEVPEESAPFGSDFDKDSAKLDELI